MCESTEPCQASKLPPTFAVNSLPHEVEEGTSCNPGDKLALDRETGSKLVWHVRHGQSTGNVAKEIARAADKDTGKKCHEEQYQAETLYIDCPLTDRGLQQAEEARRCVAEWQAKPSLVVCSPLTRAIQTAAVIFQDELCIGSAELVIRPELRECWPDNNENRGRSLPDLRSCSCLHSLARWAEVSRALSPEATADWQSQWDAEWANGAEGGWQKHIADPSRFIEFSRWLSGRPEESIAIVSHWGTINNIMNREPWTNHRERKEVPKNWGRSIWPKGGLAQVFSMSNCGWIAVMMTPHAQSEANKQDKDFV